MYRLSCRTGFQGSGSVIHDGKIYLTTGSVNTQMYIYDIATDTYYRGINAQSHISGGGAMVKGPGNSIYMLQGNASYVMWKYNIPTATTAYTQEGTYVTKPLELDHPYAFAGLSATVASPSGTSVAFETRTSTDSASWSLWSPATNLKQSSSGIFETNVNSAVARYIQIKTILTSEEGMYSPSIANLNVNYYNDSTPPSNPGVLTSYNTSTKSAVLSADTWYSHNHPYFEWSGASDGTGSGISGYYALLTRDINADATESGQFVSTASFSAMLATDGSADGSIT
jgi:hypothetical protein